MGGGGEDFQLLREGNSSAEAQSPQAHCRCNAVHNLCIMTRAMLAQGRVQGAGSREPARQGEPVAGQVGPVRHTYGARGASGT
jgi:hypothetical protein